MITPPVGFGQQGDQMGGREGGRGGGEEKGERGGQAEGGGGDDETEGGEQKRDSRRGKERKGGEKGEEGRREKEERGASARGGCDKGVTCTMTHAEKVGEGGRGKQESRALDREGVWVIKELPAR